MQSSQRMPSRLGLDCAVSRVFFLYWFFLRPLTDQKIHLIVLENWFFLCSHVQANVIVGATSVPSRDGSLLLASIVRVSRNAEWVSLIFLLAERVYFGINILFAEMLYVHTYSLLTFAYDEPFYAFVSQWKHTFGRKIGNPMEKTRSPEESSISSKLPGEKKAVYLLPTNINKNLRLRHIFRVVVGNLNPQFPT